MDTTKIPEIQNPVTRNPSLYLVVCPGCNVGVPLVGAAEDILAQPQRHSPCWDDAPNPAHARTVYVHPCDALEALWALGHTEWGYQPSDWSQRLYALLMASDGSNVARLATVYPEQTSALLMLRNFDIEARKRVADWASEVMATAAEDGVVAARGYLPYKLPGEPAPGAMRSLHFQIYAVKEGEAGGYDELLAESHMALDDASSVLRVRVQQEHLHGRRVSQPNPVEDPSTEPPAGAPEQS